MSVSSLDAGKCSKLRTVKTILLPQGWTVGTLDEFETPMRLLAERAGIFTYAVEYHLSPEVKWPTALDEGEFVVRWLIEHAAERGVDSNKASPAFISLAES